MAKSDIGLLLPYDWLPAFELLPADDVKALILAMMYYKRDGTPPPEFEGAAKIAACFIFPVIRRSMGCAHNGTGRGKTAQSSKALPPSLQGDNTAENSNDAAFESFWAAYPRKINKAAARKAFDKAEVDLGTLLRAVEDQKRSAQWLRDGGQFIPYPAKWLTQQRWTDEPAPANPFLRMLEEEFGR